MWGKRVSEIHRNTDNKMSSVTIGQVVAVRRGHGDVRAARVLPVDRRYLSSDDQSRGYILVSTRESQSSRSRHRYGGGISSSVRRVCLGHSVWTGVSAKVEVGERVARSASQADRRLVRTTTRGPGMLGAHDAHYARSHTGGKTAGDTASARPTPNEKERETLSAYLFNNTPLRGHTEFGDRVSEWNLNHWNAKGQSPLYVASRRGHIGNVTRLLDWGADPNFANQDGSVPLVGAAYGFEDFQSTLVIRLGIMGNLLAAGANPLAQNKRFESVKANLRGLGL